MIQKNQRLRLSCERLGSELEGVCLNEGMPVFVPGVLPGEEADVLCVKVQPRYAFGRLMGVLTPSPDRVDPPCPVYDRCGGCSGQHMRYEATLAAKRAQVFDCLTRIGGLPLRSEDVPPVLGAEHPWHCRNKTALPVGGTADAPVLGFYRRRSHQIVPIDDCPVAMGGLTGVIAAVKEWMRAEHIQPYDEATGRGLLRHVVTRVSRAGSLMVVLTATRAKLPGVPRLIELLNANARGFCSLHVSVNAERNNVILGRESHRLYGEDAIFETLLGLTFEMPPLSFFQVNPDQTERLYQTAVDFAALAPGDVAVDAYAGAGTLSLCLARHASRVIGIEIVPQAVEGARRNAARNAITNAEFHVAAVEDLLPRLVADGLRPDVVVLDPPRKGVEPVVIEAVLAARPRRVVYVSCHVPTQARDVQLLTSGGYRFERSLLKATEIDLADCPDLGPILFTLGCFCNGSTVIRNAGRLRLKESDRISAMQEELKKMGARIEVDGDTVTITGVALHAPAEPLYGHNDHRIVMALAVAVYAAGLPALLRGAEAVNKSWPAFWDTLRGLGAKIDTE